MAWVLFKCVNWEPQCFEIHHFPALSFLKKTTPSTAASFYFERLSFNDSPLDGGLFFGRPHYSINFFEGFDSFDVLLDKNKFNTIPDFYPGFQHRYVGLYSTILDIFVQDRNVDMSILNSPEWSFKESFVCVISFWSVQDVSSQSGFLLMLFNLNFFVFFKTFYILHSEIYF